jgi:LuxR family transcriptional regulator, maltose regulon positive regulatory protein
MRDAVLQVDLLLCSVLETSHNRKHAAVAMGRAVAFGASEGYIRPFVERSDLVLPVLVEVARSRPVAARSPYLATLMKACGDRTARTGGFAEASIILTRREMEVLELIAARYKLREIAGKQFVSPDTIKTHTRHIFEKLESRTKAEAIHRARQLGLLK